MRRLLGFLLCFCLISCAKEHGDHPPFPTTGQVLVNGEPAAEAMVVFHHLGDWGSKSIVPQAWTDANGRYVMATYGMEDGAPAGDYQVVIKWPEYRRKTLGPDRLGGKYAQPESSGLTAHVEPGTNEIPAFDLKVDLAKIKAQAAARAKLDSSTGKGTGKKKKPKPPAGGK